MSHGAEFLDDAALERLRQIADVPCVDGTRYEIVAGLGRGGMGTVYEAWDRNLSRTVALKVVTAPEAMPTVMARLEREARTLAQLEHPGITPVHDLGVLPDGRFYYTMKLVRGQRLDELAPESTRSELLRIFAQLCDAVAFAHARGVVHRDLKPQNIMVGPFGEVVILDWGLARPDCSPRTSMADRRSPSLKGHGDTSAQAVTGHDEIIGTPGYMAPEQQRDPGAVDERADVYALGALLRWMLDTTRGSVPRALAAIHERAMSSEPDHRYARVDDLAADIQAFASRRSVSAYQESTWEWTLRIGARYATPLALVGAYLALRLAFILASKR